MSKTPFNPRFVPVRTFTHPIMGRMDYYVIRRRPKSDGTGAQATFFRNNARPNMKGEYGIKLFPTAAEAFAAYQRQKIAADAGFAPPVRRMVKVLMRGECWCDDVDCKRKGMKFWYGYQTCIAYGIGKIEVPTNAEFKRDARVIEESGVRALYKAIVRLSTKGTQKDFRPLGEVFKRQRAMANDLHQDNLGFWRKRPVVIDFGWHLIGEYC
jgi:hypothetical protein